MDPLGGRLSWGFAGEVVADAEAVLKLRAVRANGDLDAYLTYHHTREHQRTYPDQHDYRLGA
ncbi:hypothetical protein [Streptomyces adustus]